MNVEFYIVGKREVGIKLVDILAGAMNISYKSTLCKCEAYGNMTRINAAINPFGNSRNSGNLEFELPEAKITLHRHNFGLVIEVN